VQITHKNIVLIFVSATIIGGAFALAEFRNLHTQKVVYSAPVTALANDISSDTQSLDTDKDGLKDWEEVLLGTDPKKADTDGDGTSDGQEVIQNRNPLVKGPNDSTKQTVKAGAAKTELSPTEKLARNFFSQYMELAQSGYGDDADSQAALANQVIQNDMVITKPKTYTTTDIIVASDTSDAAVRTYANAVGELIKKYNDPKFRNELVIAKEALEKEDFSGLKELDPIISSYKNILNGLVKIPVPLTLADTHLTMINGFNILIFSGEALRKMDTDALSGIQGSSIWLTGADGLNKAFNSLKTMFSEKKITFTSEEGGSFFVPQS
jgi:hypothetical protein